jgi:hypothetical protein
MFQAPECQNLDCCDDSLEALAQALCARSCLQVIRVLEGPDRFLEQAGEWDHWFLLVAEGSPGPWKPVFWFVGGIWFDSHVFTSNYSIRPASSFVEASTHAYSTWGYEYEPQVQEEIPHIEDHFTCSCQEVVPGPQAPVVRQHQFGGLR